MQPLRDFSRRDRRLPEADMPNQAADVDIANPKCLWAWRGECRPWVAAREREREPILVDGDARCRIEAPIIDHEEMIPVCRVWRNGIGSAAELATAHLADL